jgi:hypothetical protein
MNYNFKKILHKYKTKALTGVLLTSLAFGGYSCNSCTKTESSDNLQNTSFIVENVSPKRYKINKRYKIKDLKKLNSLKDSKLESELRLNSLVQKEDNLSNDLYEIGEKNDPFISKLDKLNKEKIDKKSFIYGDVKQGNYRVKRGENVSDILSKELYGKDYKFLDSSQQKDVKDNFKNVKVASGDINKIYFGQLIKIPKKEDFGNSQNSNLKLIANYNVKKGDIILDIVSERKYFKDYNSLKQSQKKETEIISDNKVRVPSENINFIKPGEKIYIPFEKECVPSILANLIKEKKSVSIESKDIIKKQFSLEKKVEEGISDKIIEAEFFEKSKIPPYIINVKDRSFTLNDDYEIEFSKKTFDGFTIPFKNVFDELIGFPLVGFTQGKTQKRIDNIVENGTNFWENMKYFFSGTLAGKPEVFEKNSDTNSFLAWSMSPFQIPISAIYVAKDIVDIPTAGFFSDFVDLGKTITMESANLSGNILDTGVGAVTLPVQSFEKFVYKNPYFTQSINISFQTTTRFARNVISFEALNYGNFDDNHRDKGVVGPFLEQIGGYAAIGFSIDELLSNGDSSNAPIIKKLTDPIEFDWGTGDSVGK